MDKTENTDLTEEAVTDVMYDSLNTTKHKTSRENAKEESYSEIGKVSLKISCNNMIELSNTEIFALFLLGLFSYHNITIALVKLLISPVQF